MGCVHWLEYSDRLFAILIIDGKVYESELNHQDCLELYFIENNIPFSFDYKNDFDNALNEAEKYTSVMKEEHKMYGFDVFDGSQFGIILVANDKETYKSNEEWFRKYAMEHNYAMAYFVNLSEIELIS